MKQGGYNGGGNFDPNGQQPNYDQNGNPVELGPDGQPLQLQYDENGNVIGKGPARPKMQPMEYTLTKEVNVKVIDTLDDAREVFAEEDIEDDLYLTDEADGLTQATVQQAKGAIVKSARFMQACVRVKDCPPPKHPEVAVIGRSNVGKSSLVNMLTNRKDIAKTSKNPGKTRTINHFEMITGDGTWYFVDLPGYGFANAPEEARRKWAEFTREYLLGRPNLLSVMLLIDSTVKPQRLDLECLEFLGENNIPVTVVFTKVDKKRKVKSGKRANPEENVEAFCREVSEYWDELPPMIFTSSKTGDGKQALLNHVATLRQFFREGMKGKPKNKFLEDVLKAKEEGAGE